MFNRILGEECGTEIHGDKHLLRLMKELVAGENGVRPDRRGAEIRARDGLRAGIADDGGDDDGSAGNRAAGRAVRHPPESTRPSLHLIRVDIETEVTPTVGTEEQSEELARQMSSELESDPQKMWAMSFFGKPLSDMVREGLNGKLMRMPADAQEKVQETLTRIINDGDGGMICILL